MKNDKAVNLLDRAFKNTHSIIDKDGNKTDYYFFLFLFFGARKQDTSVL